MLRHNLRVGSDCLWPGLPVFAMVMLLQMPLVGGAGAPARAQGGRGYEHEETRQLVSLVNDAAAQVRRRGEKAFDDFRLRESRWRKGDLYIFIVDPRGRMLVHPDPALEGRDELELRDIDGKPIVRGLIDAASRPGRDNGWYHYRWAVPGGLLPRWKSSYVRRVMTSSGQEFIVGAGLYNDRMERTFVVDLVSDAVARVERDGAGSFSLFRDQTGAFMVKDTYIFVIDPDGVDLVNPGFPNLEGRNLLNLRDTAGKQPIREMLSLVRGGRSGWIDYMWPKPGENVSTRKSAYVQRAKIGDRWLLVGCGVYLADAPKAPLVAGRLTPAQLMTLVRDGAELLAARGEGAFPEFRQRGGKWFQGDNYFFVWTTDGTRVLHAANPELEGENVHGMKDILGKPVGKMIIDAALCPTGEGWVHYMYPEPGDIFPTWKSTFVRRVTFPSGREYIVGSGVYNMKLDRMLVIDAVDRAAELIAERGREAFDILRDKAGPFVFMDSYVFVDSTDGVELVNPAQPGLEGKNLMEMRDVKGKLVAKECIDVAMREGSGWVDYYWFRPGQNNPAHKQSYVRRVTVGGETLIVGSGMYLDE